MARKAINNSFYEDLKERWYSAFDHPIALLRAENKVRTPWVIQEVEKRIGKGAKILDIGCGGGLLTNALSEHGFEVTGIDISKESLQVAHNADNTKKVRYLYANAYDIPLQSGSFDVVCAMDILEHVESAEKLISESARLLKPNGLFFFHTFNKNPISFFIIIKGVEWFVKNTPPNMHVYNLFLPPKKLAKMCHSSGLRTEKMLGLNPKIGLPFWKMLFSGIVPHNFEFTFCKNLLTGYVGIANKEVFHG